MSLLRFIETAFIAILGAVCILGGFASAAEAAGVRRLPGTDWVLYIVLPTRSVQVWLWPVMVVAGVALLAAAGQCAELAMKGEQKP